MSKESESGTKTRILDASEKCFADLGLDATSLRHITSVAGVNLAAIHYHFGSKDGLIRAVLSRRIGPLNQERLQMLNACEKAAGAGPLPLHKVLEALVIPPFRIGRDPERGGEVFVRLLGRLLTEPDEQLQATLADLFKEVVGRFMKAFQRALPGLPAKEIFWRVHFSVGAMAHTMCSSQLLQAVSGGVCDPNDTDATIRRLVNFLAAGMNAPMPKSR